ncbi:RICIN domain-containing protein [Lentzea sp. NPDC051208]|uniref:RICIN domain-containing protein n=1 Tax=Lentzea sp. NPDC051208 TaxID=3154642 RepID=UPI003418615C
MNSPHRTSNYTPKTRRAVVGGAISVMMLASMTTVLPGTASAGVSPVNNGVYTLTHENANLDVPYASLNAGVQLQAFTPTGGENQKFEFRTSDGVYYTVVTRHTYNAGGESGKLCLDVHNGSRDDWVGIEQYPCTGADNQKFSLITYGYGRYALKAKHSGKYVGVHNGNIGQSPTAYYWEINKASFHYVTKVIGVQSDPGVWENDDTVYSCSDGWKFRPASGGIVTSGYEIAFDKLGYNHPNLWHRQVDYSDGHDSSTFRRKAEFEYRWSVAVGHPWEVPAHVRLYCDPA